jgi:hypothetical protein
MNIIEKLRALEAKATKGVWSVVWWSDRDDPSQIACGIDGPEHFGFGGNDMNNIVRAGPHDSGVSTGDNAELIVHLRNHALLMADVCEAAQRSADWPAKQDCDYSAIQRDLESAVRALAAASEAHHD